MDDSIVYRYILTIFLFFLLLAFCIYTKGGDTLSRKWKARLFVSTGFFWKNLILGLPGNWYISYWSCLFKLHKSKINHLNWISLSKLGCFAQSGWSIPSCYEYSSQIECQKCFKMNRVGRRKKRKLENNGSCLLLDIKKYVFVVLERSLATH